MDEPKIRAWWSHRQGLDGALRGKTPREVLQRSGWARSVGGVGPYLTLFSRAGTSREAADRAVAVRSQKKGDLGARPLAQFLTDALAEVRSKELS